MSPLVLPYRCAHCASPPPAPYFTTMLSAPPTLVSTVPPKSVAPWNEPATTTLLALSTATPYPVFTPVLVIPCAQPYPPLAEYLATNALSGPVLVNGCGPPKPTLP